MGDGTSHYRYLIVGGGMTADAAVRGIRSVDATGSIGLISAEIDPPYNRPPLTKALWKGKSLDKIWRRTAERSVDLQLGRRAASLDPDARSVRDDRGVTYTYEKLLLATGGFPRRLPFDLAPAGGDSGIIYYRTVRDYEHLRTLADQASGPAASERRARFVVIGGGFIGSEIAAALSMYGRDVTMVFPDELIGQRIYPRDLADFITGYYREKGVAIVNESAVVGVGQTGPCFRVTVRNERAAEQSELEAEGVVAGIGIVPAVELAQAAGLKVDGGIVVDEGLRTSHADVYAAGDVARFHSRTLGKWMRVEHEDNANTMGTMAGKAMARYFVVGESVNYDHLPYFYSDLFDLGYEAVGELDARLETIADWQEPYRKGVVYYVNEGRVRGVLLWNVWGKVDEARRLITRLDAPAGSELKGSIAME
jgi:3-phenylpropionate/trans-cinnamate dioxygenase ferredoxin reductase component